MLMFKLYDEHTLTAANQEIVDLNRPFQRVVHRTEGRKPSETLKTKNTPLSYYVPIKDNTYGALFRMKRHGFQVHWVYSTNNSISDLFRDKALHEVFTRLHSGGIFDEIRRHIEVIIRMLVKSYSFDAIFTDIATFAELNLSIPVVHQDVQIARISGDSPTQRLVRAALRTHKELPAGLMDWRVLQDAALRWDTDFDYSLVDKYKKVLILTGTNHYYAGWLYREFGKTADQSRNEKMTEILPVTLFKISKHGKTKG